MQAIDLALFDERGGLGTNTAAYPRCSQRAKAANYTREPRSGVGLAIHGLAGDFERFQQRSHRGELGVMLLFQVFVRQMQFAVTLGLGLMIRAVSRRGGVDVTLGRLSQGVFMLATGLFVQPDGRGVLLQTLQVALQRRADVSERKLSLVGLVFPGPQVVSPSGVVFRPTTMIGMHFLWGVRGHKAPRFNRMTGGMGYACFVNCTVARG